MVGFVLLALEVEGGATFQSLFFIEEPVMGAIDIIILQLVHNIRMVAGPFLAVPDFDAVKISGNNYGAAEQMRIMLYGPLNLPYIPRHIILFIVYGPDC